MNGIYEAPESTLESSTEKYKPSFGWKILFFVLLPLGIWSGYETITINEQGYPLWWVILSLVIYSIYYVGLFGLAFSKAIGTPKFWLCYLPVQIMTDFYETYVTVLMDDAPAQETAIVFIIVVPILMITWWSTYKYHTVL